MTTRFLSSRITLGVRDVAASIQFYEAALGFSVFVEMGEPPDFAMVGHDQVSLGLYRVKVPAVADFACCYLDVEDVQALHDRCVEAGVRITAPLTHQPWGNYDFVLADPDGHLLAFGELPTAS
ncbi:VOC family protein [Jatrophihabitans sp. DSM 45814]